MAPSNWATVAFNHKGEPDVGWIKNPRGTVLRIYKNWVYLSNKKMWQEGMNYIHPTIACINSGNLTVGGFEIQAKRGPQNSIFVMGTYRYGRGINHRFFGGIGGYSRRNIIPEILNKAGISRKDEDMWFDMVEPDKDGKEVRMIQNMETSHVVVYHRESEDGPYDLSTEYLGITQRTFDEFRVWLGQLDMMSWSEKYRDWYKTVANANPLGYNQGDAFFSGRFGMDIPTIPLGEKSPLPYLVRVMDDKYLLRKGHEE